MDTSRTETTANVRKALIRHWIDLESLTILPFRDSVRVTGELRSVRREVKPGGMASLLVILEEEIRRCRGVRRVHFELENWKRNPAGDWVCLDGDETAAPTSKGPQRGDVKTHVLTEGRPSAPKRKPTDTEGDD